MKVEMTDLKSIQDLIVYCRGPVFDKATGRNWEKTTQFFKIIGDAEKALKRIKSESWCLGVVGISKPIISLEKEVKDVGTENEG